MKKNQTIKTLLSLILCFALLAAAALGGAETAEAPLFDWKGTLEEPTEMGEGETAFMLRVADLTGRETYFLIHTDEKTVGDALLALGIVEGEMGSYGLYIKAVCGIAADYETDGHYWAFYIGEDYAMTGVDQTEIAPETLYALKVE